MFCDSVEFQKSLQRVKKNFLKFDFCPYETSFFNENSDDHKRYRPPALRITSKLFEISKFNCLHKTLIKNDERN